MRKTIGIIGYGNMGSAIAEKIRGKYELFVFDKDTSRLKQATGVSVVGSIAEVVTSAEAVIIAVKPQDFDEVLGEVHPFSKGKIFISIAVGIKTTYIERKLGDARVIRAMPNLGAIVGRSVTCICRGRFTRQDDLALANDLFSHIGRVEELPEDMMDIVTGVSGSGPGYYFDFVARRNNDYNQDKNKFMQEFIVSLTGAAREAGLDANLSELLAREICLASDLTLVYTKLTAEELRKKVASKGGTTEAGLEVLQRGGSLTEAVQAAVKRAKELSKKE